MDWALIACILLILNGIFILFCFVRLDRGLHQGLSTLDEKIAGALARLVAENLGDFEPPNQVHAAIAEFIRTRMGEQNPGLKTIARAADGKFEAKNQ
jgi:hypothetical protein